MKRLHSLDTKEVSIVPRGANKKKWLVLKSALTNNPISKEEMEKIIGSEPDTMGEVDKLIKGFQGLGHGFEDEESEINEDIDKKAPAEKMKKKKTSKSADYVDTSKPMGTEPQLGQVSQGPQVDDKMAASMKAAVRILSPHKGKLPADLLLKVLDAAGIIDSKSDGGNEMDMEKKKGSSRQSPEPIKDEHKIEAMKVAKEAAECAYKGHLEKLGYQKYPTEEMQQKSVDTDPDEPAEDDEEEGLEHNPDHEMNGMMVQHKSVKKSLDLSKLPKEARPAVTQIFKAHQELVQKNESLTKQVEQMARREIRREFVAKTDGMKHLGVSEDFADTLITLSMKAPKEYAIVEKVLLQGNENIKKSALFTEIGSNLPDNTTDSWSKIEKAAEGYVQKSGTKMSSAEAVSAYIETDEGRKLYNHYLSQHASSRGN